MRLLRVEACRLDLEFLDRISRRYEGNAVTITTIVVCVRYAIERELVAPRSGHAVRDKVRTATVVERPRELQVADVADARRQPHQRKWIAIRKRQLRDAPPIDHLPGRSRRRFERRRVRGHVHGL